MKNSLLILFLLPAALALASPWGVRKEQIDVPVEASSKTQNKIHWPDGVANVALGADLSFSGSKWDVLEGELSRVIDGYKTKNWKDINNLGEIWFGQLYHVAIIGKHNITIDLGEEKEIHGIGLWYWHEVEHYDVPYDVVVELSSNPSFDEGTFTAFNCDHDDSIGRGKGHDLHFFASRFGKIIKFSPTRARYIRVWGNGGARQKEITGYVEIEAFGKRTEKVQPDVSGQRR